MATNVIPEVLTEAEHLEHVCECHTLCLNCLEWTNPAEANADGFECLFCDDPQAISAEDALAGGHITIAC